MNAELIAVGTELLLGSTVNSDAAMLSQELSALGIGVYHHTVVGDNPQRLREAIDLAKTRADLIITTGGLGPTYDDLTKTVVAEAFGKQLVFDPESADIIRNYFAQFHRPMTENNLQQAYLPEGCIIFKNDFGTAPACAFEADGTHVIMLPGPPRECMGVFRTKGIPYLATLTDGVIHSRSLRIYGVGESALEMQLRPLMQSLDNPTLAPYAKESEVELRITAKAGTVEAAQAMIAPVEAQVREILGDKIYGTDVADLQSVVVQALKERGKTVSTAESCTGGLVANMITDVAGASAVFSGGFVTYSNQAKTDLLGVPAAMVEEHSAVSAPVAQAMAEGARQRMHSDFALAVTGVAGPDSDERGNPVGLIFVALASAEETQIKKLEFASSRQRVRRMAAMTALDLLRKKLAEMD